MAPLTKGDLVRVHPVGRPDQTAVGTVQLFSSNGCAIAVSFGDSAPFAVSGPAGVALHLDYGIMLLAHRERSAMGLPWGPWIEEFGGRQYVIEEEVAQ